MRISWDDWGVPTVEGTDDDDVSYGVGYAQATAHATQVLELYGVARGRAAALWGQAFVGEDTFHAELALADLVDHWYDEQQPSTMARIEAYCDGFNAACTDNPELGTTRQEALPVTPRDVIAHTVRIFTRFTTMDNLGLAFAPYIPSAGSNGWAVSAGKSSTGKAMLVINPHLAWVGLHRWFEFRSVSPGREVHGITLLGLPWQTIGFNRHAGWTHTVNPVPLLNVYDLGLTGDGYLYDGEQRRLDVREQQLEVRDGEPVTVRVRRSVHGPVVTAPDGTDVAVRVAGVLDKPTAGALEGWWQMSLAHDVREIIGAARQGELPLFNVIAADSAGSAAAAYCATPAVHKTATYADVIGRMPGHDPAYLWDDVHPATSMPQVVDPECGWVQNCNEPPWWYTHPPLDPGAYPPVIAPPPTAFKDTRSAYSRSRLEALETISPEQLLDLKWSTRVVLADVMLDELCEAAGEEPDLQEAVQVLTAWDRNATADSPGYPLFLVWFYMSLAATRGQQLVEGAPSAGELPTRLVDQAAAVTALRTAVIVLTAGGHQLDVAQKGFVQMRDGSLSVGGDGGSGGMGVLKDFEPLPVVDGSWRGEFGDSWVALVEFGADGPPKAQGLLVYGNTTEPSAPTYRSQIDLFARNELRPIEPFGDAT